MEIAGFSCSRLLRIATALGLISMVSIGGAQAQTTKQLPTVIVISTGGTIASKGGSTTALSEYKSGSILGEDLVSAVPEISSTPTSKSSR